MIDVVVLESRYVGGWPEKEDERCGLMSVEEVLTTPFDSDVHFTAYSAKVPRRHTNESVATAERAEEAGVEMRLAVFDVDGPGHEASDEWRKGEIPKLTRLEVFHPGVFGYHTPGGYRLVFRLITPIPIRTEANGAQWSRAYVAWCNYLERRFGIIADRACKGWTRLYRAPRATKDTAPLALPTFGDVNAIGHWLPALDHEDYPSESDPAPAATPGPGAPRASARTVAAATLAAAWPEKGRHTAQLALAGALRRDGWSAEDALEFLCDVCGRAGSEERPKREQTIRDTWKGSIDRLPGWPAVGRAIGEAASAGAQETLKYDPTWEMFKQGAGAAPPGPAEESTHFSARIKRGADWAEPYVRPPYLLDGLVPLETVATFFAEGGSVKSWSAFALAIAVATGTHWLGLHATVQGKVLILDFEDGWAEFRRRREILMRTDPDLDLSLLEYLYCGPNMADPALWSWISEQDYRLVVIDALSSAMPSDADENDQRFAEGLKYAGRFVEATGCNVLAVHHANKTGGMRGSSSIRDQSDVVFRFVAVSETDDVKRMRMECDKPGPQKRPAPVNIELNDKGLTTFKDEVAEAGRNALSDVDVRAAIRLALDREGSASSQRALREMVKKKKGAVAEELKAMVKEGEVVCIDGVYSLEDEGTRTKRILAQLREPGSYFTKIGELARQARVSTHFVEKLKIKGDLCVSADGRWLEVVRS